MSDGPGRDEARGPDLRKLAQDWITLWQSELAALAADREAQETWQAMLALLGRGGRRRCCGRCRGQSGARVPRTPGQTLRRDGAAAAPGAAAAAAAPDARDAEIERLARRIAELEARLAELERRRSRRRSAAIAAALEAGRAARRGLPRRGAGRRRCARTPP